MYHRPVLAEEAVKLLVTRDRGVYIDLTCGGGGHLMHLSGVLSREATLIGLDRDLEAVAATRENLKSIPQKLEIFNLEFARFDGALMRAGITRADGILLDLGVSSHQLDSPGRGFAFMQNGPLDMRMGSGTSLTAEAVVNEYSQKELVAIFRKYGEERRAARAAAAIYHERRKGRIRTTEELVRVLRRILPARDLNASLARIFQAIRIEVNKELDQLQEVLPKATDFLADGGHLVVISYHSLEDRMVKRFMAEKVKGCICPSEFPVCVCGRKPSLKLLTRKPLRPTAEEIAANSRAKSAKLRAAEKIG